MTLEVYRLAIETLRLLRPLIAKIARHDPDLARQLKKAGASVALNTAEGSGASGGSARNHFCIARGSARESIACLEVAEAYGYVEAEEIEPCVTRFDRIARMLTGLIRR